MCGRFHFLLPRVWEVPGPRRVHRVWAESPIKLASPLAPAGCVRGRRARVLDRRYRDRCYANADARPAQDADGREAWAREWRNRDPMVRQGVCCFGISTGAWPDKLPVYNYVDTVLLSSHSMGHSSTSTALVAVISGRDTTERCCLGPPGAFKRPQRSP